MNLKALVERRTRAYKRACLKNEAIDKECYIYEKNNDGFLSSELLDKSVKAQDAESRAFAALVKAEKALADER